MLVGRTPATLEIEARYGQPSGPLLSISSLLEIQEKLTQDRDHCSLQETDQRAKEARLLKQIEILKQTLQSFDSDTPKERIDSPIPIIESGVTTAAPVPHL